MEPSASSQSLSLGHARGMSEVKDPRETSRVFKTKELARTGTQLVASATHPSPRMLHAACSTPNRIILTSSGLLNGTRRHHLITR
mmetsp:Transcript_39416/g.104016  ORF Transcript_39416/g.104016 Transcript_39416/m.104016 type:complete len:85 (+) Transcript_39416:226-480(+)